MSRSVQKSVGPIALLNIGVDGAQLRRRRQILVDAGFKVLDADTVERAVKLAGISDIRVAIFGHRISSRERLEASNALKRSNPAILIVVMYETSVNKTELADAVLQINLPPADLVHSIEYLLSDRSRAVSP